MSRKLRRKIGNLKYFSKYTFCVRLITFFFSFKRNRHYFLNDPCMSRSQLITHIIQKSLLCYFKAFTLPSTYRMKKQLCPASNGIGAKMYHYNIHCNNYQISAAPRKQQQPKAQEVKIAIMVTGICCKGRGVSQT